MRSITSAAAGLALLVSGALSAQSLPRPEEFYFDEDRAAHQALQVVQGDDDATIRKLTQIAERNDRNADKAHAQVADLMMATGRTANGKALYEQLLARLDASNALRRPIGYRFGWHLYRAGEWQAALEQWTALLQRRGINPSWAPPTLALVLWKLDRRNEAIQWYAAAVRTEPRLWSTTARYATLLPEWSEQERSDLAEVQAAWAKAPPAWP